MLKSNENMKMKMGGQGTAQSLVGHALSARHQDSDLHTLLSQGIEWSNKGKQTMKKLMFVAAAALCGSLFADVTSANVVGYSGSELRFGSLGVVPQFAGITEADGSVDLQSIKCTDECSDNVSFKILNNIGISDTVYLWVNWYDPGDGSMESCWVDGDYAKVEGMKIQPGQGMWVAGSSDAGDQIFTSSGQVNVKDVTVALRFGSVMTGNPTPVAIDLQDIICSDPCSDNVSFKFLNNIGISDVVYLWVNWYDPGDGNMESCWVDGDYAKVVGMTIDPGQGMWVAGSADPVDPNNLDPEVDQLITFPGVEL